MFRLGIVVFQRHTICRKITGCEIRDRCGNAEGSDSCTRLYWVPFRDAVPIMKAHKKGFRLTMSKPEAGFRTEKLFCRMSQLNTTYGNPADCLNRNGDFDRDIPDLEANVITAASVNAET